MSNNTSACRENAGLAFSLALLTAAIWSYPELFMFSKTLMLPAWAKTLPGSLYAGGYLGFIALLPIALLAGSKRRLLGWYLPLVASAMLPASLYHHLAHPDSPWQLLGNCAADLLYASLIILSGPQLCALAIRLWREKGSRIR